jgi:hypothetical protein
VALWPSSAQPARCLWASSRCLWASSITLRRDPERARTEVPSDLEASFANRERLDAGFAAACRAGDGDACEEWAGLWPAADSRRDRPLRREALRRGCGAGKGWACIGGSTARPDGPDHRRGCELGHDAACGALLSEAGCGKDPRRDTAACAARRAEIVAATWRPIARLRARPRRQLRQARRPSVMGAGAPAASASR